MPNQYREIGLFAIGLCPIPETIKRAYRIVLIESPALNEGRYTPGRTSPPDYEIRAILPINVTYFFRTGSIS